MTTWLDWRVKVPIAFGVNVERCTAMALLCLSRIEAKKKEVAAKQKQLKRKAKNIKFGGCSYSTRK